MPEREREREREINATLEEGSSLGTDDKTLSGRLRTN